MKIAHMALCIVIVAILVLSNVATAHAAGPSGNWRSGIACQNLDTTGDASVVLTFYPEGSGTAAISYTGTIPAGGSKNWLTTSSTTMPGFPSGFIGGGVVSSDKPLTCNVNTELNGALGTTSSQYRSGTSSGLGGNQVGPKLYVPQVMRNYYNYNSYVAVQNTGGSNVTVNVKYFNSATGAEVTSAAESATIPAQSTKVFYQADNTNLGTFLGSMTIEAADSTTALAAVANIYNNLSDYTKAQLQSYNGVASGASTLLVPRFVRSFYGYNSGTSIQNIGTAAINITITFSFAGNTYVYNSTNPVQPGASLALYAPNIAALAPVDTLPVASRSGSAIITATKVNSGDPDPVIVAIINEDNRGGSDVWRNGQGSTYNAFPLGSETKTVFFSQVTRKVIGFISGGFQIANTTNTDATCDITYAGVPAAKETGVALSANGSLLRYAPNVANLPDGFNAAVTVTCTQPIVGISNFQAIGKYGDSFIQTTGLNQ